MSDLISRQAAIDSLISFLQLDGEYAWGIRECLNGLPSAESKREKGKWEIYVISMIDGEGCKCSECGFEGVPYWDFCPNCGAKME